MMTQKNIMRSVLLLGLAVFMLVGCGTTRLYNMPYSEAESILFEKLHLDKEKTLNDPGRVQAKADGKLANTMAMKLYAVEIREYTPGTSLSFICHHLYNIGAVGGEHISFDLQAMNNDKTKVKVDYSERSCGTCIPFAFWNPGGFSERNIHNEIWRNGTANQASQTIGSEASPQSGR